MLVKKIYQVKKFGAIVSERTDYLLFGFILVYRKEFKFR